MSYKIKVFPDGTVWHEDEWRELAEDSSDDYYVLTLPDEMECPEDECELPPDLQMNRKMVEVFVETRKNRKASGKRNIGIAGGIARNRKRIPRRL